MSGGFLFLGMKTDPCCTCHITRENELLRLAAVLSRSYQYCMILGVKIYTTAGAPVLCLVYVALTDCELPLHCRSQLISFSVYVSRGIDGRVTVFCVYKAPVASSSAYPAFPFLFIYPHQTEDNEHASTLQGAVRPVCYSATRVM